MNDRPGAPGRISLLIAIVITAVAVCLFWTVPSGSGPARATAPVVTPGGSPADTSPEIHDGDIACEISTKKTRYVVGESPEFQVRLHNRMDRPVTLVGSLDASDLAWRYPHCSFQIEGPEGHQGHGIGRCGNTNPLRRQDFVPVPAGESFDPFMRIDDYGFFGSSGLDFTQFQVPGRYRVTFRYSTKSANLQEWVGIEVPPGQDSEITRLFQQVPKFETTSNSIELTFSPPPGGYVPGFKTPLSRSGEMGAHFLRLVLGRHPILPPQMDVVWLADGLPDDVTLLTDLNFVDGYLAAVLPAVFNAGGRWTHHVATFEKDAPARTVVSWQATQMTGDASGILSRFKPQVAATQQHLLSGLQEILNSYPLDPADREPSVVVFILTEKPFGADDVRRLIPPDSDPAAVFRVSRLNGTWIPEKLTGHIRRPQ